MINSRLITAAVALSFCVGAAPAGAATFTVNTTKDHAPHAGECASPPVARDCSLRQAVAMANSHPNSTIVIPAGTYRLTIAPAGPDDNSTGDLNLTATATISGAGASKTIIEAGVSADSGIDRELTMTGAGNLHITGVTLRFGNTTSGVGGAIFDETTGLVALSHVTMTGNQSADGGALAEEDGGAVRIMASTISDNFSESYGGGLTQDGDGAFTISRSTIEDNTSIAEGGGITQEGRAPVTITGSTISGNTADWGGGIAEECCSSSTAPADTLINDTITNNHAIGPAGFNVGGGGLNLDGDGTVVIQNSTISANTSTVSSGANIYDDGTDPVDLTNTIVSGGSPANCAGADIFSTGTHGAGSAAGHNLFSDSTCGSGGGDHVSVNPKLGPLADYGGLTYTEELTAGSPAINAGTGVGCPATDQRGVARPQGPHCDIGAYEVRQVPFPTITSLTPSTAAPGRTATIAIHGSNFQAGAKVDFGPGITVTTKFVSATLLTAKIDVLAAAESGSRTVSVVNPDLGAGACNLCFVVSDPSLPGRIVFQSNRTGKFQIYVMRADGTNITRLTHDSANDVGAAWSPDHSKIAFVSDRSGHQELYVMNANGTGVTQLTNTTGNWGQPTWSPDGSMLADENNQTSHFEIYTMSSTPPASPTPITTGTADYGAATWSPDGTKLAVDSNSSGSTEIWTMAPNGTGLTQLTSNPGARNGDPEWSPDGAHIVFDSTRDGNFEIYSMNTDGSNQTRLTNNPAVDVDPTWSPDSNWIAFQSNRSGNAEIFTMKADGSQQTERTFSAGAVNDGASWGG